MDFVANAGSDACGVALGQTDAPFRVRVRSLALVTGITCVVAHGLSQIGSGDVADHGPLGVVVGQAVWNAAQVGFLLILLCLWSVRRRWWVVVLGIASLACLPFAIYAISPGAWVLTAAILATCALTWASHAPDLGVSIIEAPARGTPVLSKVEFLAVACNLFSSMYNYEFGRGFFPYWSTMYKKVGALIGFTPDPDVVSRAMFTLGIASVSLPPFILSAKENALASFVFLIIWSVLPTLYVLYFAACALLAKHTPGTRIQQALCLFGIVHFLFLTDIVDYQYGRGILNPWAEWCHWTERLAWRIAILLPLYQHLASGHWRRGNGVVGVALHYTLAVWGVVFFVYMVLIYDAAGFYQFLTGGDVSYVGKFFGPYSKLLGYPGALILMTFLYGFAVIAMRCHRTRVWPLPSPRQ